MQVSDSCRQEVEALHEFFVGWYAGQLDRDAFDRMADAIAPGFEMVTPDGDRLDREAVLAMVREAHGRDDPGSFEIEIRNVTVRERMGDHVLVRYEEWQTKPGGDTGRLSTALFREEPSAPGEFHWLDLHETWIDQEG